MKEIIGDIWNTPCNAIVITTNGIVKMNGELVMGKGIALEANNRFTCLAWKLGQLVRDHGNNVYLIKGYSTKVISFPTKNDWRNPSDMALIIKSTGQLVRLADDEKLSEVILPRVGCGCGGLIWGEVRSILERFLDHRFTIVHKE
jgi:O-acetyl-ADP-ribose deacetylase (regulator of RNase III)